MIKMDLRQATLDTCVNNAQRERIILTRRGKPVALIIGVEGMDEEQLQLGSSDKFWKLIAERRTQKTMTRAQLEQSIKSASRR
jgi:antitoxin (DNA-binding transcriptional repressor) of toxin-antitoxin stability system